ncbi:MAG TPA: hypothetical protein VH277_12865 [Gemmatimonadaceae bacterium]|jgi:hypothetical protein|nr:hypothetical protein [Gemmatimonadaceae bacterium]
MGLATSSGWLHRWLWFGALYVAGVCTLAIVGYVLRVLLKALA